MARWTRHRTTRLARTVAMTLLAAAVASACGFRHPTLDADRCDGNPDACGAGVSGAATSGGASGSAVGGDGASGEGPGGSAGNSRGGTESTGGDGAGGNPDSGGEAGGGSTEPPVIVTEALSDATFRMAYSFELAGSGGTGEGYVWTITSGALPPGLSLARDGTIRGEPRSEGIFPFDVTLTDSGGASTARTFGLDVRRKRWLVYHSDEEVQGQFRAYAVDVARTLDPPNDGTWKWPLSETGNSYVSPPPYAFSPDGRWLAYLDGTDTQRSLYVRDMSGLEPGGPRRIDNFEPAATNVSVKDFDWSPDSRLLAFSASLDAHPVVVYYTDFRFDPPSGPIEVHPLGTSYSLDWVSNEILTYSNEDGMSFARRDEHQFVARRSLGFHGYVRQRWPELNVAAFDLYNDGCDGLRHLVDFRSDDADVFAFEGPIQVSRDFEYLAHWNPPSGYQIYPMWQDIPVAVIPSDSTRCAPGAWSNDGRRFVSAGYEDQQLYVAMIGDTASVPVRVSGSHPAVGGLMGVRPEFSPDDAWLVFSSSLEFFLAPNTSSGIGPSVAVELGNHAEGWASFRFAPNSAFLAGSTAPRATGLGEVFLVDLRSGAPEAPLRLLPRGDDGLVNGLEWSVDSTRLAFVMRESAYPAPYRLYVVDPEFALGEQGSPIGTDISSPLMGCSEGSCQFVAAFAFQP